MGRHLQQAISQQKSCGLRLHNDCPGVEGEAVMAFQKNQQEKHHNQNRDNHHYHANQDLALAFLLAV